MGLCLLVTKSLATRWDVLYEGSSQLNTKLNPPCILQLVKMLLTALSSQICAFALASICFFSSMADAPLL